MSDSLFNREEPEAGGSGGSHDRWLISWADFITLMFAVFLVLYARVPKEMHEKIWGQVMTEQSNDPKNAPLAEKAKPVELGAGKGAPRVRPLRDQLQAALKPFVDSNLLTVSESDEGLLLEVTDKALFSAGTSDPSQQSQSILVGLAYVLRAVPNKIRVEGHTDDVDIHTARFPSNWELSTSRASRIVRILGEEHIADSRLSAAGYGPTRPLASNETDAGRSKNRRVSIIILDVKEPKAPPVLSGAELQALTEVARRPRR